MEKLFRECGDLDEFEIIYDKYGRHSRGFGFARFTSEESALAAIERFNGFVYKGRKLKVKMSE